MNTLRWYSGSCDENRKCGTEHEDNGKETERKAKVTMAQQHQPPGGKEHQPQSSFKRRNGAKPYKNRTEWRRLVYCHIDKSSSIT